MTVVAALTVAIALLLARRPAPMHRLRGSVRSSVPRWRKPRRVVATGDWSVAVEVLAACVAAGASTAAAVDAAAAAAPPPVAQTMRSIAVALRSGSPPEEVWIAAARACPQLDMVAAALSRSSATGAASAGELMRLAARERSRRLAATRQAVGRASTWIVLPLGACFLPAFVLIGVVPVLIGAVHELIR